MGNEVTSKEYLQENLNLAQYFTLNHKYSFLFSWHLINDINRGKNVNPICIEIHPTFKCNLKCSFCHNKFFREQIGYSEVNGYLWQKTIESIMNNQSLRCVILNGGGEPLIYHRNLLMNLLHILKEREIVIAIVSNATLISNDIIDIIKDHPCIINISIKGTSRSNFKFVTGYDLFDVQRANLDKLLNLRKEYDNKLITVRYVVSMPLPEEFKTSELVDYLEVLFNKGLNLFLITFSNPKCWHDSLEAVFVYKKVYNELLQDYRMQFMLSQGNIRFSNLKYLQEHNPNTSKTNTAEESKPAELSLYNDICYVSNLFHIIEPRGLFRCFLGNPEPLNRIKDFDNSQIHCTPSRCMFCRYYSYNTLIDDTLNIDSSIHNKKCIENEDFLPQLLNKFVNVLDKHTILQMKKYVTFYSMSKNEVLKRIPFIFH